MAITSQNNKAIYHIVNCRLVQNNIFENHHEASPDRASYRRSITKNLVIFLSWIEFSLNFAQQIATGF